MIYFGCDPENAEWCLNLCKKEMRALYEEKIGTLAVETSKGSDGGATGDLVGELRELDVVDREEFLDLR